MIQIVIFSLLILIAQAYEPLQQVRINESYKDTLKIAAQNYTFGIRVDWGNVEQLKQNNQSLELVIEANITKYPKEMYQIPFLCINNQTATQFSKDQKLQQPRILAIDCDFYGFKTNEGKYRIDLNSSLYYNETTFYISFFNLTSLINQEVQQIPIGNITFNNTNELLDNNYWEIDFEVGIYEELDRPLYCNERGIYNNTSQICFCQPGFAGINCEFELQGVTTEFSEKIIIAPFHYQFFKFDYNDQYNLIMELNNTIAFNLFFCDQDDTQLYIQHKFIATFKSRNYRIQLKNKQQLLPLPYNATVNSIVYWIKNDNVQPLELDMSFKLQTTTFLEEFIQVLVNYLFYTFLGGFLFCGCSFCMVFVVRKVHNYWTEISRRNKMEKQLPKMTFLQFKSNAALNRNSEQTICSICLGEFEDSENIRVTKCRHTFHNECIEEWAVKKNQCPVCRETIFTFMNWESLYRPFQRNNSDDNNNQPAAVPPNIQQNEQNRYQNLIEMN